MVPKPVGESLGKDAPGLSQTGVISNPKSIRWLLDRAWVWEAFNRHRSAALFTGIVLALVGAILGYRSVNATATVRLQGNAVNEASIVEIVSRTIARSGAHAEVSRVGDSVEVRVHASTPAEALQGASVLGQEVMRAEGEVTAKLDQLDQNLAAANRRVTEALREADFADLEKGTSGFLQQHEELYKKLENMRIEMDTLDLQVSNLLQLIIQHHPALMGARKALEEGLLRYTEEHPKIQEYRRNMRLIEMRIADKSSSGDPEIALTGSSLAQNLYAKVIDLRSQRMAVGKQWEATKNLQGELESKIARISDKQLAYVQAKSEYDALRGAREKLAQKREANQSALRIVQPAQLDSRPVLARLQAGALWGAGAGILGLVGAGLLIALVEVSDRRIRSARELARITGLPVLGSLGKLEAMTEAERRAWAFKTLTALQGKVAGSSQQALVCGIVSSQPGEGRSTWVRLLAEAARERGYKVLALDFNHAREGVEKAQEEEEQMADGVLVPQDLARTALLARGPARVQGPNWAWDMERRTQWQEVLEQLKAMQNLVLLFELPPASAAEAILLSENVTPLLWLCGRDRAESDTTCAQLETLRNARGRVVGSVFNQAPRCGGKPAWKRAAATICVMSSLFAQVVVGQEMATPVPATSSNNAAPMAVSEMPPMTSVVKPGTPFAVVSPATMADWQKRLTLGPGDALQIALYEHADSSRPNVVIGPDGRLNYLQARDFMAAGLTVDELRDQLEKTLLKYYQPPLRVIVVPQSFRSKRYYVLGNVVGSGVYSLDRPMTVIEAIATAGGFVSVMERRHSLTMADLSRSFLVRKEPTGEFRRMDVNFEKLFMQGDLTQNVALAPDDYLYFPPLDLPEVYVLGEVLRPGVSAYAPGMSAIKAIASAGGFTPKAWRQKVLIVRGSLTQPKAFMLDAGDVLTARGLDFKLEARDLVYVSRKPWSKIEELLELAITDFLDAAIITYTGRRVGPFITTPIVK